MPGADRWPQYKTRRYQLARAELLASSPMCFWGCGRPADTADHVPPLVEVGAWHWNLVPACRVCNYGRRGSQPTAGSSSREW